MTATVRAEPASDADARSNARRLVINVITAHNTCLVHVTGELDLATRNQLLSASTAEHHPTILIDLGGVTFMDCSGYSSLVAARRIIEGEGRSLTITGQTGQPARLLDMIGELQRCPLRPALHHRPGSSHHLSSSCRDDSVGVRLANPANARADHQPRASSFEE